MEPCSFNQLNQPTESYIKEIEVEMKIEDIHPNSRVLCILILFDKRICTGGDGSICICSFDIKKKEWNRDIFEENIHYGYVSSLCQVKNNELISSSVDSTIKIWKINNKTKNLRLITVLRNHKGFIFHVTSLTKNRVASCSSDSSVKIWDNNNNEIITTLHEGKGWIRSILQLKNREILITSNNNPSISFWNLISYERESIFNGYYAFRFSHIIELSNGNIALSSKTEQYPIVIINTITYTIENIIYAKENESSLCNINNKSFIYIYFEKLIQLFNDKQLAIFKWITKKELDGYRGIISMNEDNLFIVQNNCDGFSIIKIIYG